MKKGLIIIAISMLLSSNLYSEEPIFFIGGDIGISYSTTSFNQPTFKNNENFLNI